MLNATVLNLSQLIQSPEFQTAYVQMTVGGQVPVPAVPPTVPPTDAPQGTPPPTVPPTAPPPVTPPTAPPASGQQAQCQLNSDCPVGQHCANGICNLECRENRDCSGGMTCNIQNGRCE